MAGNSGWHEALEAARQGDLSPARELRAGCATAFAGGGAASAGGGVALAGGGVASAGGGVASAGRPDAKSDYFYGRCLAEAGEDLEEALVCLRAAADAAPQNALLRHVLALALARSEWAEYMQQAAEIWAREGLPHDVDLLGQTALVLEGQTRAWPASPASHPVPWPESLARLAPGGPTGTMLPIIEIMDRRQESVSPPGGAEGSHKPGSGEPPAGDAAADRDKMTRPAASIAPPPARPGGRGRRRLRRALSRLESLLMERQAEAALRLAGELIDEGLENGDIHLAGGLAADELGDSERARAHLVRAIQLNPKQLIARAALGRVYWREGWFELALAVWRSLPVEGPYDHGRHYHMALGHAALGDRAAAFAAMRVALSEFFYETRHFYIEAALERWKGLVTRSLGLPSPEAGAPAEAVPT